MGEIRLLIVDDHQLLRRGLRQLCEAEKDLKVVGEAVNGRQAIEMVRELEPDVVLMDIQMPVLDGVQATAQIISENPRARVIILTMFTQDEYVFQAIKAGASGYLLKDTSEEMLLQAIRTVYGGGVLMDAKIAARTLEEFRRLSQPHPASAEASAAGPFEALTEGEMEILRLVAAGEENPAIARQLNLSEKTISNRLSQIYQKLQVSNRVQATLYAIQQGWATLPAQQKPRGS